MWCVRRSTTSWHGESYASIVRALEDDNATLDQRDRVTIDSVRNHTVRHFPVQNVARATYRDILERRANENGIFRQRGGDSDHSDGALRDRDGQGLSIHC